jgi:ABC-type nickel/cobalt efflux system permease component RcnA
MAELLMYPMALLHGQAADFMIHFVIAVIQLAVASLKVTAGVCAVVAAALTLAAACVTRRQHTHPARQEKRLRNQQRRRNIAARAHRSASVRDSTSADGGQARQSRPQPQPSEYGANDLEGEL